ncbi:DUF2867 domain-containing protein [Neisseria sp.]|uniref:DUF2867 domain-containing protein n=1 Tax=Neisseria sp. TaxID=192066 RepID=UPI0035A12254
MNTANIPPAARLLAEPEQLDYLHTTGTGIPRGMSAWQVYAAMTDGIPAWLAWSFRIRDGISRLFGVKPIRGFSRHNPHDVPPVGGMADFFRVEAVGSEQLVLLAADSYLAVMVSIDITRRPDASADRTDVTASVKNRNAFGRLYMLPVALMHGAVVRRMLRNIGNAV